MNSRSESSRSENKSAFVISPEQRHAALDVVGTKVAVLGDAGSMRDLQVTLQSGEAGMGPPPHSHDWDESFYVTKGVVVFSCNGETTACSAGTLVHVPAGTVHAFSYGPDGGEMLEMTGKGSQAVKMFTALDREVPPGPPDIPKVIEVLADHGVTTHL